MRWGGKTDFLEKMEDSGREIQALKDRPTLDSGLEWYLEAFNMLSGRRTMSMEGPNPIAMSDIVAFLQIFNWFDTHCFIKHISTLDDTFLKYQYDQAKQKRESSKKPKKP